MYLPELSVTLPLSVPSTTTFAPINGLPSLSLTTPTTDCADHLIATVKTVNSGAITALTLSGNQAINDGKDIVEGRAAKEFAGATFTYEAVADGADAGTGATFKVHKCQRYAAWKVDVPRHKAYQVPSKVHGFAVCEPINSWLK